MPRLLFKGKVFVENHHLAVLFHELLPMGEKGLSEKASLRDNLIVRPPEPPRPALAGGLREVPSAPYLTLDHGGS